MTRIFASFETSDDSETAAGFDSPNGGVVAVQSGLAPVVVSATQNGTGFGPLWLGAPAGDRAVISDLRFRENGDDTGDGGSGGLLFGALAVGAGVSSARESDEEPTAAAGGTDRLPTTRRRLLTLGGAIAAGLAVAGSGLAEDELVTLRIARFDIEYTSGPLGIRVLDIADEVLPVTTEMLVDVRETRVGEIVDAGETISLPPGATGEVRVYLRDTLGRLAEVLAWISSLAGVDLDAEIDYTSTLGRPADEYDLDEFVRLTDHPAIVDPVRASMPERAMLSIGNTSIPHADVGAEDVGSWDLFDDALVYEVGPDPPPSDEWRVRARIGRVEAFLNRL